MDSRDIVKETYNQNRRKLDSKDKDIREKNRNHKSSRLPIIKPTAPINRVYENKNMVMESRKKNQFNKSQSSTIKDMYKNTNYY